MIPRLIRCRRIVWTDRRLAVRGRAPMPVRVGRVVERVLGGPRVAASDIWGGMRSALTRELAR